VVPLAHALAARRATHPALAALRAVASRWKRGLAALAFHVQGDRVVLGGVPRPFEPSVVHWSAPLVRGVWHEYVLHVRWSADPRRGLLELWYDGVRVLPLTHVPTLFPGQGGYLKVGLYRHPAIRETQVVFHDGFIAGASRADVLGNAALARAGAGRSATGAEARSSPARDGAVSGDGPAPAPAPQRRTETRARAANEGDVRVPLPIGGVELACDVVRLRCKVRRSGRGAGRRRKSTPLTCARASRDAAAMPRRSPPASGPSSSRRTVRSAARSGPRRHPST
jgi:hypothetical protein